MPELNSWRDTCPTEPSTGEHRSCYFCTSGGEHHPEYNNPTPDCLTSHRRLHAHKGPSQGAPSSAFAPAHSHQGLWEEQGGRHHPSRRRMTSWMTYMNYPSRGYDERHMDRAGPPFATDWSVPRPAKSQSWILEKAMLLLVTEYQCDANRRGMTPLHGHPLTALCPRWALQPTRNLLIYSRACVAYEDWFRLGSNLSRL